MQRKMMMQQLTAEETEALLKDAPSGNFATVYSDGENAGYPYVVPVNFVYVDKKIYIHGLPKGQKTENLKLNNKVGFEVHNMKRIIKREKASTVSTEYESAIITGTASLIDDFAKKKYVLTEFVKKYAPNIAEQDIPEEAIQKTGVIEIAVKTMTGKYNR